MNKIWQRFLNISVLVILPLYGLGYCVNVLILGLVEHLDLGELAFNNLDATASSRNISQAVWCLFILIFVAAIFAEYTNGTKIKNMQWGFLFAPMSIFCVCVKWFVFPNFQSLLEIVFVIFIVCLLLLKIILLATQKRKSPNIDKPDKMAADDSCPLTLVVPMHVRRETDEVLDKSKNEQESDEVTVEEDRT
ncbi:hypothetical protein [Listeria booriae]|uniref:Uncharacterized protein n=1 Tax=Listeria booriae TaxID=1552123 RepID=A0A7X1CB57_9LIST|nr:hypothetical protein [Listeria booriae]MBC1491012.1 hypothetical protein [Listeria booriae]MBC1491073.1 hypothetical protein [Listeria booriae]MBC2178229.1 hypothetical protein [Listeria booriae]MBC2178244.1 hypothetical protein [Listeria booriae]MBC2292993.1 hypothetical protein [Listeria booriae]